MSKMQYGHVPGVDKPVSRIVQGTTMINEGGDEKEMFALLDAAFENGCNAFDTAHIYGGGGNERMVGNWIRSRGIREEVVIIAKGAHHSRDRRRVTPWDISADLHDSLARFQVDYIDLYILHRDDPTFPVSPIIDCLNDHEDYGRISAFGGSNWSHIRLQEAARYADLTDQTPFAASSPNFSLAEQHEEPWPGCVSISGTKGAAGREWYRQTQFPVFAWSTLASGFWSDRYSRDNYQTLDIPAAGLVRQCYCREDNFQRLDRVREMAKEKGLTVPQLATAYVFSQPLNVFGLIASANRAEFEANLEALSLELTAEECSWLDLREK